MDNLTYLLFEFGYALIFGIFGLTTLVLSIPKEKGIEYYKKSRLALGTGLCAIAAYCIIRIFIGRNIASYVEFWLLVTFTLIHSWSTYGCLLFLMEVPRYKYKSFFIDGLIPAAVMLACGFIGIAFPESQKAMTILFGFVFGIKCLRMFAICFNEYRKCQKELDNYYDEGPDIKWIRNLIFLSLFMSGATIISFYIHTTPILVSYYLTIPVIYAYIVYRVLDFMPKKIEAIRAQNISLLKLEEEEIQATQKTKDLSEKLGPKVDKWIEAKLFCKPDLNIKDVAMQIGTNQSYLSVYLNKHHNMTFQVWLNRLRIEESKLILASKEKLSIEEVGARVGIPQSYNFSRWFKIITDMTPYQFRKLHS
ncbi:MAG: helix-turn-helix transcriptional regulator [Bacteroidales bacterium]|nr:helix-turn-helix transcriptional regulator [Bacteroidales bacterium]